MDELRSPGSDAAPEFDVTALAPPGVLLEALTEQLAAWIPAQRWYAHRSTGAPTVSIRGWAPLRVAADHLVLMTVVGTVVGDEEALYQVPLVLRRPEQGATGEAGAEIGVVAVPGGPLRAEDAPRTAEGRAALLGLLASSGGAVGPALRLATDRSAETIAPQVLEGASGRLLSGEQSNTSMIFEAGPRSTARPVIIKLFRLLQDGDNPDVVLQTALGASGSTRVPPPRGSVRLALGRLRTHALFAQEFLPGVEDAWRTALEQARDGTDFSGPAALLGSALAEVHRDLAGAFGTSPTTRDRAEEMVARMREQLDRVASELPEVLTHRERLRQLLEAAGTVDWPPLQRIHGDLHLGQVLATPGQGWVLLDFEGEPLRPLAQRSLPDCPLRDVAGMLRSLDYAAGAVAQEHGLDASAWAIRARRAVLDRYTQEAAIGVGPEALHTLIAAFEADKAVYEALYEARHRPDWLPIPLAALARISAGSGAAR